MNGQLLNEEELISVINELIWFECECDMSRVDEGAAVRLQKDFMSGATVAANKSWLIVYWKDAEKHEDDVMSYAEVVNRLFWL